MTKGYIPLGQALPPIDVPIICRFFHPDMPEAAPYGLHGLPNAMSKAIRRSDGKIYYHSDTNPGRGEIRSRWIEWKCCWW